MTTDTSTNLTNPSIRHESKEMLFYNFGIGYGIFMLEDIQADTEEIEFTGKEVYMQSHNSDSIYIFLNQSSSVDMYLYTRPSSGNLKGELLFTGNLYVPSGVISFGDIVSPELELYVKENMFTVEIRRVKYNVDLQKEILQVNISNLDGSVPELLIQ